MFKKIFPSEFFEIERAAVTDTRSCHGTDNHTDNADVLKSLSLVLQGIQRLCPICNLLKKAAHTKVDSRGSIRRCRRATPATLPPYPRAIPKRTGTAAYQRSMSQYQQLVPLKLARASLMASPSTASRLHALLPNQLWSYQQEIRCGSVLKKAVAVV